jgi:uncharacterized membrane protein
LVPRLSWGLSVTQLIEFSATREIMAPPENVWRIMTDIAREPQWMTAVGRVDFIGDPSSYAVGARMRRSGKFLWIELVWESEIVTCEPPRLIRFLHSGAIRGESRWEIEPMSGRCRVRLWSRGPAPGPLAWLPSLAVQGGRLGLRGDLARLKRVAESAVQAETGAVPP